MTTTRHDDYMRRCIALAQLAPASGDVAVGSLIVKDGAIVAEGIEAVRAREDVTAHAEIEALRAAFGRLGTRDLSGCTLYTSVEPCVMCAYAIRLARVAIVVSGARSSDARLPISGHAVLTGEGILPGRRPPEIVRDVLAAECSAVRAQP
jgi:tRNA(adenine34) deaminase